MYIDRTTTPTTTIVTVWWRTNQEFVYSETWRTSSRATPTPCYVYRPDGVGPYRLCVYTSRQCQQTVNGLASDAMINAEPSLAASAHVFCLSVDRNYRINAEPVLLQNGRIDWQAVAWDRI